MSLVLGLGTLTMPFVLKQLGWFGVVVLAGLALLSAHTAKLLCKCIDYEQNDEIMKFHDLKTYSDIGEAAFGKRGRSVVNFILYTDLVASSALFLVFIATNMEELTSESLGLTRTTWIILTTFTLFPTVHLKLNKLSILSKVGSFIMIILVLGVVYAALIAPKQSLETNEYDLFRFELGAIGNMVFAFSCHGTLLTVYRQMERPQDVNKLFDKVYLSGYMLKFIVGTAGYYIFAQNVSDQISLNLPTQSLRIGVTLFVTFKKWLTYALPLEPVAIDLTKLAISYDTDIKIKSTKSNRGFNFTIRSCLVFLTGILAFFLPYFGLFQSLVGALCAGFLVLVFPIGFYLKLYGKQLTRKDYFLHCCLLALSIFLVIISSYYSLCSAKTKWDEIQIQVEIDA